MISEEGHNYGDLKTIATLLRYGTDLKKLLRNVSFVLLTGRGR
jgi:hypothetical protein